MTIQTYLSLNTFQSKYFWNVNNLLKQCTWSYSANLLFMYTRFNPHLNSLILEDNEHQQHGLFNLILDFSKKKNLKKNLNWVVIMIGSKRHH